MNLLKTGLCSMALCVMALGSIQAAPLKPIASAVIGSADNAAALAARQAAKETSERIAQQRLRDISSQASSAARQPAVSQAMRHVDLVRPAAQDLTKQLARTTHMSSSRIGFAASGNAAEASVKSAGITTVGVSRGLPSQAKKSLEELPKTANPALLVPSQGRREMTGSQVKRLRRDMRVNGFDKQYPIEVVNVKNKNVIYDGHHRTVAARQEGIKEVPVKYRQVSAKEADDLLQDAARATGNW